eukprot:TRINITY_DN11739_c1_g1_i1.p2 TRINITY_DN11739_c1_g1~~TRINITY_DN11739_c1_g1_i1.p2  ORF type:complete len:436 (+),score=98.85 TRINITY_DN11739_c1_g1_i1:132-1310(+)
MAPQGSQMQYHPASPGAGAADWAAGAWPPPPCPPPPPPPPPAHGPPPAAPCSPPTAPPASPAASAAALHLPPSPGGWPAPAPGAASDFWSSPGGAPFTSPAQPGWAPPPPPSHYRHDPYGEWACACPAPPPPPPPPAAQLPSSPASLGDGSLQPLSPPTAPAAAAGGGDAAAGSAAGDVHPLLPPAPAAAAEPSVSPADPSLCTVEFKHGRRGEYWCGFAAPPGTHVVVTADRGTDLGLVTTRTPVDPDAESASVCGTVVRPATDAEVACWAGALAEREREAVRVAQRIIEAHAIPVRVVRAEWQFDGNKLTLYYVSRESRPQVRAALDDCYAEFRCRIWFSRCPRQLGRGGERRTGGGVTPAGLALSAMGCLLGIMLLCPATLLGMLSGHS